MIRSAIVTGASSGIGRAAALALAESGWQVALIARREALLEALSEEIEARGGLAKSIVADLSNPEQCAGAIETARSRVGGTPSLVNAAGVARFANLAEDSPESVAAQIQINLVAPILCSRAILPWMAERGGGHILNVASVAGITPFAGASVYGSTKAGLLMFGKALAAEVRTQGIRVTTLVLGATDTELWDAQSFVPSRGDMLRPESVAAVIRDVLESPCDTSIDRIDLMPPKGIL